MDLVIPLIFKTKEHSVLQCKFQCFLHLVLQHEIQLHLFWSMWGIFLQILTPLDSRFPPPQELFDFTIQKQADPGKHTSTLNKGRSK